MSWRVARSLDVLLGEINEAAPLRSKASDGSIGDADHASRESDHNPWVILAGVGIVRARDFTHDPAGGLDCNQLAAALAALIAVGALPACRSGAYVIWNRRIFSFDRRTEGWRPYTGSNPHDHHCHLSVSLDPAGFDSTAPWGVMVQEDPMADYAKQLDEIQADAAGAKAASERAVEVLLEERQRDRDRMGRVMKRLAKVLATSKDDATKADLQAAVDELTADE